MKLIVQSPENRSAGASFTIPIVFFVLAFLGYGTLLVVRDAWLIQGTLTMPTVPLLLITVARALLATLFVGFSSRFYANLDGARAVALAATVFVIGIVWETVIPFVKVAGSSNLFVVLAVVALAAYGILPVLIMASFIPYFRKAYVWVIFLLLWTGGAITASAPEGYVFVALRSVALAALGYWLQRAGDVRERVAAVFD